MEPKNINDVKAYLSELDGGNTTFKEKQILFKKLREEFKGTYSRQVIKVVANKCEDLESGRYILEELIQFV